MQQTPQRRSIGRLAIPIIAICAVILAAALLARPISGDTTRSDAIYWGALIKGSTYSMTDAPWDMATVSMFEQHTKKKASIIHWGQPWWFCHSTCDYQPFTDQLAQYNAVRARGSIPLVDWGSWDYSIQPQYKQPDFSLDTIITGKHDAFIRQWATDAKAWGHPFFLRFNWEMNGKWYPWSERRNGNEAGEFVKAWQHVHNIFRDVGATNVTWVWCPVALYDDSTGLQRLYPGDAYVDWTCVDAYNWGTNPNRTSSWRSFAETLKPTYDRLLEIAPSKPIMIGEFASSEHGGSKAQWITDALAVQLPQNFPMVKAIVWFNWDTGGMDWTIETSSSAQSAFAKGIASTYYTKNDFANLNVGPIPPYEDLPSMLQQLYNDLMQ